MLVVMLLSSVLRLVGLDKVGVVPFEDHGCLAY